MQAERIHRKYALTRVKAGDYILPSNDGRTLWRFATYTDGPSNGLEDMPRDRQFWGLWRWSEPVRVGSYVDTGDWSRWEMVQGLFDSRADAIEEALRVG